MSPLGRTVDEMQGYTGSWQAPGYFRDSAGVRRNTPSNSVDIQNNRLFSDTGGTRWPPGRPGVQMAGGAFSDDRRAGAGLTRCQDIPRAPGTAPEAFLPASPGLTRGGPARPPRLRGQITIFDNIFGCAHRGAKVHPNSFHTITKTPANAQTWAKKPSKKFIV